MSQQTRERFNRVGWTLASVMIFGIIAYNGTRGLADVQSRVETKTEAPKSVAPCGEVEEEQDEAPEIIEKQGPIKIRDYSVPDDEAQKQLDDIYPVMDEAFTHAMESLKNR